MEASKLSVSLLVVALMCGLTRGVDVQSRSGTFVRSRLRSRRARTSITVDDEGAVAIERFVMDGKALYKTCQTATGNKVHAVPAGASWNQFKGDSHGKGAVVDYANFYTKYTNAYNESDPEWPASKGIPILGSAKAPDAALLRARATIIALLKKKTWRHAGWDVRDKMLQHFQRVIIGGVGEQWSAHPEFGVGEEAGGANADEPSTGCESSKLCYAGNHDFHEHRSVCVEEFVHSIEAVAIKQLYLKDYNRIQKAERLACNKHLWARRWSDPVVSGNEYYYSGVETFFTSHDNPHEPDHSRDTLIAKDPVRFCLAAKYFDVHNTYCPVKDCPLMAKCALPIKSKLPNCEAILAQLDASKEAQCAPAVNVAASSTKDLNDVFSCGAACTGAATPTPPSHTTTPPAHKPAPHVDIPHPHVHSVAHCMDDHDCEVCHDDGKCAKCWHGYVITPKSAGVCVPACSKNPYCSSCDILDPFACASCSPTHTLFNGACLSAETGAPTVAQTRAPTTAPTAAPHTRAPTVAPTPKATKDTGCDDLFNRPTGCKCSWYDECKSYNCVKGKCAAKKKPLPTNAPAPTKPSKTNAPTTAPTHAPAKLDKDGCEVHPPRKRWCKCDRHFDCISENCEWGVCHAPVKGRKLGPWVPPRPKQKTHHKKHKKHTKKKKRKKLKHLLKNFGKCSRKQKAHGCLCVTNSECKSKKCHFFSCN